MTMLNEQEMIDIQRYIDQKVAFASSQGLQVNVDDDLWTWRELMRSAPGAVGASKSLDPLYNDIRPGNSFWVNVTDRSGNIVGCQVNRFFETEDFVQEYICTHRLFGDRCPSLQHYPLQIPDSIPVIRGRINFGGGGWVHPDWRKKAISGLMSRVARTLALRHFLIDYYTGFITATDNRRKYGHTRQGLTNRRQLFSGTYPGRGEPMDVDIYWLHRGEIMSQISAELKQDSDDADALTKRTA